MTEKRVKISSIVQNQLPEFVQASFPLAENFLNQYYKSTEYQSASVDILNNIDQYIKIDNIINTVKFTTLSSDVSFFDATISVDSTAGFPPEYGLIQIDSEIITYTGITSTSFTGCVRGFSGVTTYTQATKTDELVFVQSESSDHESGSSVVNLSILLFQEFYTKVKKQIAPGFEGRSFYDGINDRLLIKQLKDFYTSKGTDSSFKVLFNALYGKPVEIIKPRDYLIQPSDAQYRITQNLVVEALEGNPLDLVNTTLYQDEVYSFPQAQGTIALVEKFTRGSKDYYTIGLDFDYNKDLTVRGTVLGKFSIHPTTKTTRLVSIGATVLDVDSTVGFPNSGSLIAELDNGTSLTINYGSKTLTQFFECSGITQEVTKNQNLRLDVHAYGYVGVSTSEKVKVRVTGVLSDFKILDDEYYYQKNDSIQIKTLGNNFTDYRANNWFFNVPVVYDVRSIDLIDNSDFTYRFNTYDEHNFVIGDIVTIVASNGSIKNSFTVSIESKNSITLRGQGQLTQSLSYTVEKNVSKVNSSNYSNLNIYSSNVQNTYEDSDGSVYVTSSSLPTYLNQPLRINDRSVVFSGEFTGTELQIGKHGFYTGDEVVYSYNGNSELYFVEKVNDTTIKLAKSRANIFTQNYVGFNTSATNAKIEFSQFTFSDLTTQLLEPQKLIRKISDPQDNYEEVTTSPGLTGIFINGVELSNYKTNDFVYYGEIQNIISISPGKGYDVINPPVLTVTDDVGFGAGGHCSVVGNLKRIEIIDPGFDYLEIPTVTITGGNGSGAIARANLIDSQHIVSFNSNSGAGAVDIVSNTIGFSTYHKFRDYEEVIYDTNGSQAISGITTGSVYYVSVIDAFTVKLHENISDSIAGINTISLNDYGIGNHTLRSTSLKKKISSIVISNSGQNYENKKITCSPVGINTAKDTINIKNHGYETGELIKYSSGLTSVGGLTDGLEYYVTKVSEDEFSLSQIGVGTDLNNFYLNTKQYVNLTSTGSGVHTFNCPEILVSVAGKIGISTLAGQDFNAIVQPIFRGIIESVHVSAGGTDYGSENIINYNRQPDFTLNSGSLAQVTPIISNGKIVEIVVNNFGSGYNSPPDLIVTGSGVGAVLTPIISNGQLVEVKVIFGGSGYSSSTFIEVRSAGQGAKFESSIKSWNINLVDRLISTSNIVSDDGVINSGLNDNFGLEYTHCYSPRKLRSSVLSTVIQNGIRRYVPDLQLQNGRELNSNSHSPIIGWAYDGNPIYGPYGYSNPFGGTIKPLSSGYVLNIKSNRPSISLYPEGFFVEDYTYAGQGDLDQSNGRFCLTPEYPNGTYAYFCTVDPNLIESDGPFENYKKPIFPYVIGDKFKSKPIEFNFKKSSNQDEFDLNQTGWIRNTTPYNLTKERSYYQYLLQPNKILNQESFVQFTEPGKIEGINVIFGGSGYKVGEKVLFDLENTEGRAVSAKVSSIKGKVVNNISVASSTVSNIEFYPIDGAGNHIGFATSPHEFSNNDLVTITTLYEFKKLDNISTSENVLSLSTAVEPTVTTGLTTYFNVNGSLNFPNIRENDVYLIGDEQVKILKVDNSSSRIWVLRNQNGTSGISTQSVGVAITEKTRKFVCNFGISSTSYNYNYNKEIYFTPAESLGIGTTAGVGIGSTLSFSNPGVGISHINIPTRSIYLPNHKLQTGLELVYSSNGLTPISISTNGVSSFTLEDNSIVYTAKISEDLIGISTVRVGLGTTGVFVGIGTSVSGELLYFTGIGTGTYHSFTTVYPNIVTGQISKNVVTVSTASTSNLIVDDKVSINVKSGLSTTVVVKYDDYNRRMVINPKSFISSDVNLSDNTITINNHGYFNGQKIIYTASSVIGGLQNEGIYFVVYVDDNKFKLAETYYASTKKIPDVVNFTSSNSGTISEINPPLSLIRNESVIFDVSDSSLSFTKGSIQYPAFILNFYKQSEFIDIFDSSQTSSSFEVIRTGVPGIDSNASVALFLNDNVPQTLFYKLDPIDPQNNVDIKTSIIVDVEQKNNNQLIIRSSLYNGTYSIVSSSSTSFKYILSDIPERFEYFNDLSTLEYSTTSTNTTGEIKSITLNSKGYGFNRLPLINGVDTVSGSGALLEPFSKSVGSVKKVNIQDIGFDYSSDLTLKPSVQLPTILKIEALSSFESIGVSSVGKNYSIAPDLVVIDSITNKRIFDIDLKYTLGNYQVTIFKNTYGISDSTPSIVPINNSNGIDIGSIVFDPGNSNVIVTLGASFSDASSFPFNVGDEVLIENVSVGVGTTALGYNSENYDYSLFTITNVTSNIGGIGATVTYNLSNYLENGEVPGNFNPTLSAGKITPKKYFPIFNVTLKKNDFLIGEPVHSGSTLGKVVSWQSETNYLKVSSFGEYKVNSLIRGETSNSQGIISEVLTFDSVYNIDAFSTVINGWERETGFLNNDLQRIHDNNYYQYFSYSLKSQVPIEDWDETVSSLNHTSGFKKFSDLVIESIDLTNVGIATSQNSGTVDPIADLSSVIDTNCVFDFDLVSEGTINIDSTIKSNEIIFNSKILQDYIESVGNRVLVIDDISGQFSSDPRPDNFSIVDTFSLGKTSKKYIIFVQDKRFITQRQINLVSLVQDGTFGFINQYGGTNTFYDMGYFDFLIIGTEANLLFYPTKNQINNFDISTLSYSLEDTFSGIGTLSVGDIALIQSNTATIPIGVSTATPIVSIASTYSSSKIVLQISSANNIYYEFNEITVLYDGTNVSFIDYGSMTTDLLNPESSTGIGTYNAYISGSNIIVDITPNVATATSYRVNTVQISIADTATGISTSILNNSRITSSYASISSSPTPTSQLIAEYPGDYESGYFIVNVHDTTNNTYQVSEVLVVDDDTNAYITEFASIESVDSLGIITAGVSGQNTNLYFTPIENIDVQVRVFQNSLGLVDQDIISNNTIDLDNASIDSGFGEYFGAQIDVVREFQLYHKQLPIFQRPFVGNDSTIVDVNNDTVKIPGHYFVTGEEVSYSFAGAGTTQSIGIATTSVTGFGVTDKLPSTVYIIKEDDLYVKFAGSLQDALKTDPVTLNITHVGIGTSHTLTSKNPNSKVLISIDNNIQTPIVSTAVTTTVSQNIRLIDTEIVFSGITSFFSGDLFKIGNEIMLIDIVGYGATNIILVNRAWMGSPIETHAVGSLVTKISGDYNIVNNTINFVDAPRGPSPISTTSAIPSERDYVGLETHSTFGGRVFLKSGIPDSEQGPYTNNYIFDDISSGFNGINTSFVLKSNTNNVTGVSTGNVILLVNNIFQGPSRPSGAFSIVGDYSLEEVSGVTTVTFTGNSESTIPTGGVIVSVASTEGFGYQPLVSAGGTATVSIAGTISTISIGNSGSGYRTGIQTEGGYREVIVNVGVATSSTGIPNIEIIGKATISNGNVVGVSITNPGIGYTSSNPPIVIFDDPLSYSNVPLIYSSSSRPGLGTGATVDIVVGQGSSVINFELVNIGSGYGQGEILTVAIGGTTGIQTNTSLSYKEFQITVDRTFTDEFCAWSIGDLEVFDVIDDLFDGFSVSFPLSINGQVRSIKSKIGSNIDIQSTLLVFLNDILQVPGQGYIFEGGSVITFTKPPIPGDTCKIIFYQGNGDLDTRLVDVLETVKVGDDLTINSDNFYLQQTERLVNDVTSTNTVITNVYGGQGISLDETLLRSVTWCRQTEDKIINGQEVSKDRALYEPKVQPTTNIIQNVSVASTQIFVESVKTFFDSDYEYIQDGTNEKPQNKITLISQDNLVSAAATAIVSTAGTISSVVISNGGIGYETAPQVSIELSVGIGTSQRATATSTISVGGTVTSISVVSSGTGYTSSSAPLVLIESPSTKIEVIDSVVYGGDFGVITGVKTTTVGVASTGIVFDLFIPLDSYLRDLQINSVGIATTGVSGIQTGYYFVVSNSNIGNGLTSIDQNGSTVGVGSTFIDNIYQAVAVSIAQTSVTGVGITYVSQVTVSVADYNGLSGVGFSNFYGEYSWGRIETPIRKEPQSFNYYNNALIGITTSPVVQRFNSLRSRNYNT